jgi:ribosomal protein S18 acetylase RimI-like enzyme
MEKFPTQEKLNLKISKIEGPQDFDTIMDIQKNDGFEHSYYLTEERLGKLHQRGEEFFIVHLDNKPVAFASVDMEVRAKLHFFCVNKDNAGKGIGTELLEKTIQEVANQNFDKIHTFVETDSPAEHFYTKNKFKKVGVHKDRYGEGKDSNILERKI